MTSETLDFDDRFRRITGRESRTRSIATRFTHAEAKALQERASANGQNLREWARGILLDNLKHEESRFDIVCELVGLELLFMNLLAPLSRGERLSDEQFNGIVQKVQTEKVETARHMLYRRREAK